MYDYLTVKSSDTLEDYYRYEENYRKLLEKLNEQVMEDPVKLLETQQYGICQKPIWLIRQRQYRQSVGGMWRSIRTSYGEALQVYHYLNTYIGELNGQQFLNNSSSYQALQSAIWYLEIVSSVLLIMVMGICMLMLYLMVKSVSAPLTRLAATVKLVGQANFNVKMPSTDAGDEVGVLTRTFNSMVSSLEEYVNLTKENMVKEQKMMGAGTSYDESPEGSSVKVSAVTDQSSFSFQLPECRGAAGYDGGCRENQYFCGEDGRFFSLQCKKRQ